jgi:uncharacterized membrane protein (UPF0127 family)
VSTRARLAVAGAIALLSAAGIVVLAVHWLSGDSRAATPLGLRESPAAAPFHGAREVSLAVGKRCVRVVVADTEAARERGLRGAARLGPYGGMLFVQSGDTDTAFTMTGVTVPLAVTWYTAGGSRIGAARMAPCPRDAERCPVYRSRGRYRLALETPPGAPTPVHLLPCS